MLLAVFGWLWNRHRHGHGAEPPVPPSGQFVKLAPPPESVGLPPATQSSDKVGDLSPTQITAAIKASSPFTRPTIAKNFLGTVVQWDLWLEQILQFAGNEKITLRMPAGEQVPYPGMMCTVEVNRFPFLKYVHEGSAIRVHGEIERASELELVPTHVELTLLQPRLGK